MMHCSNVEVAFLTTIRMDRRWRMRLGETGNCWSVPKIVALLYMCLYCTFVHVSLFTSYFFYLL